MLSQPPPVIDQKLFRYLLKVEGQKAVRYLNYFSLLIVQLDSEKPDKKVLSDHNKLSAMILENLIRDEIRETDLIGRQDSDKFCLVLHQTDSVGTFQVGERIRNRVKDYTFVIDNKKRKETICIGVTSFPSHANDIDTLIIKANQMLENAKMDGGDRVYFQQ